MAYLLENNLFRLRISRTIEIDYSRRFSLEMDDSSALIRFRFTIVQLHRLADALRLPDLVKTDQVDKTTSVEAFAMLCRRLAEPIRLSTMANEFGRSPASLSRIIINLIYEEHRDLMFFNEKLASERLQCYTTAVRDKGAPLDCIWAFIDSTKQYTCRPSARGTDHQIPHENLQRSVYNGHLRRHCLNYQGVTTPDGFLISMFGPVEGRRHDSTMLAISGFLERLRSNGDTLKSKYIYGDPAYGCSDLVCCPFASAEPGSRQSDFSRSMSSVREAVEWSFGRPKTLWPTVAYDKKIKVRQVTVGRTFLVSSLLTNCHCCLQPNGNQISMYFGVRRPTLEEYFNN